MKAGKTDKKREIKRNYDSGIFMGSDSEPPSSDSYANMEEELMRDLMGTTGGDVERSTLGSDPEFHRDQAATPIARRRTPSDLYTGPDSTPRKRLVIRRGEQLDQESPSMYERSSPDQLATQIVRRCLDEGQEIVDLSGYSLPGLPPEIRELVYLTKQTNMVSGMMENGTSFEARLRLFLANNYLRTLPLPVLDLTNLRELSLRRNKLTKLPAGIRNLVNLERLNVSGNKLSYVPFEIVELAQKHHLFELITFSNSWEVPAGLKFTDTNMVCMRTYHAPEMLGPSDLQLRRYIGPRSEPDIKLDCTVPSLTEMCLRQMAKLHPLEDLRRYVPLDTPSSVLSALQDLHETLEEGGIRCNRCGTTIVQPATQEIEWWYFADFVPVRRIACNELCQGEAAAWADLTKVSVTNE